jgi:hypothetical protein
MAEKWEEEELLAAAFFFARWRVGGSSGKSLFPTIAYQLALHSRLLRTAIGLAVEADPAICDKSIEQQARDLIINPLAQLDVENDKPYLIIVDGLDECEGKEIQGRIVKVIFQIVAHTPLPMRFLICSRPEPHIREAFESSPSNIDFRRLVLDDTFHPGRDILRYLRDRFSQIQRTRFPSQFGLPFPWPSERDLEKLVNCASGQFIYAATVVKFVGDEYCHPVEQLRLLLDLAATQPGTSAFADLDALYTFIISANPNTSLLVRILGTYFAIPERDTNRTHCVSFLDDILGLTNGTVRFALRGLHSLLFIPDSDQHRIWLHHASLHDFLFNPGRAGNFFLNMNYHHEELSARCFSLVLFQLQHPKQDPPPR